MKVLIGQFVTESNANIPHQCEITDYDIAFGEECIQKMQIRPVFEKQMCIRDSHRAVFDLDRRCGAAFKHAAADCRRAGQRDAGRLHGHDLLPQI